MNLIQKALVIIFSALLFEAHSQGCNDAGLCTTGNFGNSHSLQKERYTTELSYIFGLGEAQTILQTFQFDQRMMLMQGKIQFLLRVPFVYVHGNLANTAGLGDVTIGFNGILHKDNNYHISALVAGKIPSNGSNLSRKGKSLPMVYQTSLGTYDVMAGINLQHSSWLWGLGFQYPFGSNQNGFLYNDWADNDLAQEYWESAGLKRGPDLVFRADKMLLLRNNNNLQPGLTVIFRIQKDKINVNGEDIEVNGSDGITINANLSYNINFENNASLKLLAAAPIITKEVRPDGLTRSFVLSVIYTLGKPKKETLQPISWPEKPDK